VTAATATTSSAVPLAPARRAFASDTSTPATGAGAARPSALRKQAKFAFPSKTVDPVFGWFEKVEPPKPPTPEQEAQRSAERAEQLDERTAISPFSASLLSLAQEDPLLGLAGSGPSPAELQRQIQAESLQIAPEWDVPEDPAEAAAAAADAGAASTALQTQSSSSSAPTPTLARGSLAHAFALTPIAGLPAEVAALRVRSAAGEVLTRAEVALMAPYVPASEIPIPKEVRESGLFGDLTTEDFKEAETAAREVAKMAVFDVHARQPFDTVSKVVKTRLADLPLERAAFFKSIGMHGRPTASGFVKYLRLQAVRGSPGRALAAMVEMKRLGMRINLFTYTDVIGACARTSVPGEDAEMLAYMQCSPATPEAAVHFPSPPKESSRFASLVSTPPSRATPPGAPAGFVSVAPQFPTYGTRGTRGAFNPAVELAFFLFEEARAAGYVPDRMFYTALISACCAHRQLERAFAVFELMRQHAAGGALVIAPRAVPAPAAAAAAAAHPQSSEAIAAAARTQGNAGVDLTYTSGGRTEALAAESRADKVRGLEVDPIVVTKLMHGCWKAHQFELAEDLMHDMWSNEGMQPDAVMYNLMIRIAAETEQVEKAFRYFEQLQHFGFTPSIVTYTALIHACVQPNRPEFYAKAFEVFGEAVSQGFHPNVQMYGTLLHACAAQVDLNNGLLVWRSLSRHHPHLRDTGMFEVMMQLLRRSMHCKKLPGLGGSATVTGSASLYGDAPDELARRAALGLADAEGSFELSRENRLRMAESLYSELRLLASGAETAGDGKGAAAALSLSTRFLNDLVGAYAHAMVGVVAYEKQEETEGRGDGDLPVSVEMIEAMVQRAWDRVRRLKDDVPEFQLTEHGYTHLIDMYGVSGRMSQMFYHFNHMVQDLKIAPTYTVFNRMIEWAKDAQNVDAGLRVVREMHRFGKPPKAQDKAFFKRKETEINTPIPLSTFPRYVPSGAAEERFENKPRQRRDGSKPLHPHDYNTSYKAW
jgi:pentatricopeptide repeat protein